MEGASPSPLPVTSIATMTGGGLIIAAAQAGLGRRWRVGVPREESHVDELIATGLHRFSRNPVYVGVIIFLVGASLAAPGPFTGSAVVVSYIGLTFIIRQDERYLKDRFGAEYEEYSRRVRRWI